MKWERLILIAFFANYIINNVVAALAALVPATPGSTSILTPQYITFIVMAAIVSGLFAWWYLKKASAGSALKWSLFYGVLGFVISIATTFVSGVAGVLAQTGSLSEVASVLPNFGPFLFSTLTLVLLGYWIIPALVVGWFMGRKSGSMAMHSSAQASQPM